MGRILDLTFTNRLNDLIVQTNYFPLCKIDTFHVPFEINILLSVPSFDRRTTFDFAKTDYHQISSYFENVS